MNEQIFREYDIRGVVARDLVPETVEDLGKAVGTHLLRSGATELVLGRDCRLSSESLRDILVRGLLSTGVNVIDIGVCHTPLVYFSLFHLSLDGGVMITGSHNPPECNGFKVCRGRSTIYGAEIQALKNLILARDFEKGAGSLRYESVLAAYWERIAGDVGIARPLKVVVDAGNGTAGAAAVPLFMRMGCEVIGLFCDMNGNFPNHHPDPTVPAFMQALIETVKSEKADIGIAFDGDGDRIGAVDEQGAIIWGDQLLIIYAREILKKLPGAAIISEVKASQGLYNDITSHGGRAVMWKTGHSLIKAKMKEEGSVLAGEMSGHMFFADRYFGFDDAVYAACRLLEILSKTAAPASSLLADVPRTFTTPEIRVDCPDDKKFPLIETVRDIFRKKYEVIDIDGARILMPGGWGLVRASNTQPVLVLRFEADTPGRLDEIRREVEAEVQKRL